jgi:drug/metabolite transporter (DMT)-like permease
VKWITPTIVTLVILLEPVGSTILGLFIFGEVPGLVVLGGAVILLIGVGIAVYGRDEQPSSETDQNVLHSDRELSTSADMGDQR